jgi:hypothetical protein
MGAIMDSITVYQVRGWYKNLALESVGKPTTISDGALFSDVNDAIAYCKQFMHEGSIYPIKTIADIDFKKYGIDMFKDKIDSERV